MSDYYATMSCKSCGETTEVGLVEQFEIDGNLFAVVKITRLEHFEGCYEYTEKKEGV